MPELEWHGQHGFLKVLNRHTPTDHDFDAHERFSKTELGMALNRARLALVRYYARDMRVVEIGIGGGQFVAARPNTYGYDVGTKAIQWLRARNHWHDPYRAPCDAMCFWGTLDLIEVPRTVLKFCEKFLFVSLPTFRSRDHVLRSQYYQPTMRNWYFTHDGFVKWIIEHGFVHVNTNEVEERLGLEDYQSFVFCRRTELPLD